MRACPAGLPVKAHAPYFGQVTNIRLRPSPRVDIDATKEAKGNGVANPETLMTVPSSSGWNPISALPSDRKDGRRMLLWDEDVPVIGRWDADREGWEDPESMCIYHEIALWADILTPD